MIYQPFTKNHLPQKRNQSCRILLFDTETVERPTDDPQVMQQVFVLGYFKLYSLTPKKLIENPSEGFFYTTDEFFDIMKKEAKANTKLPLKVMAYNAGFDCGVLKLASPVTQQKHGYRLPLSQGIAYSPGTSNNPAQLNIFFDIQFTDHYDALEDCEDESDHQYNVKMQDLQMITPNMSLGKLAGLVGDAKEELPQPTWEEYTADPGYWLDQFKPRVKTDVEILGKIYKELNKQFVSNFNTQSRITIASTAQAAFAKSKEYESSIPKIGHFTKTQQKYLLPEDDGSILPICPPEEYVQVAIDKSYHGGRTESFFRGKPSNKHLYKYDFNSMYPHIMKRHLPLQYLYQEDSTLSIKKLIKDRDHKVSCLVKVNLNIPPTEIYGGPGYVHKTKSGHKLIFPVGKLNDVWLWKEEALYYQKKGYITHYDLAYVFASYNIAATFVDRVYAQRLKAKKDGNDVRQLTTKLILNSLYGKFGQKENGHWDRIGLSEVPHEIRKCDRGKCDGIYYHKEGDIWYRFSPPEQLYKSISVPQIASYVAAMGRLKMAKTFDVITALNGRIYYCDTDSIVTDIKIPEEHVSQSELGKLKLEGESKSEDCYFLAPKSYRFNGEKPIIKGHRRHDLDNTDFDEQIEEGMKSGIYRITAESTSWSRHASNKFGRTAKAMSQREMGASITYSVKTSTNENTKRIVTENHAWTKPIAL